MTKKPPEPPEFLSSEGAHFWRDVVNRWELARHELELLGFAAASLDAIAQARASIKRDGQFVKSERGRLVVHPAVKIVRDAQAEFRLLVGRLKLTGV
jgi:phage terminase small subunit